MTTLKWITVKSGWVLYSGDKAVGVVFKPRPGSWYSWKLVEAADPYGDDTMGRVRGREAAMNALRERWQKELKS